MLNVERVCISTVQYILYVWASALRIIYNNYYCHHCGCPACVCVPVRSFLPPRASKPRRKTFICYNGDFCWKCFVQKLRRHCLPRMSLTTPEPQNTDTNGIHATWAWHYYSFTFFVRSTLSLVHCTHWYLGPFQHGRPRVQENAQATESLAQP